MVKKDNKLFWIQIIALFIIISIVPIMFRYYQIETNASEVIYRGKQVSDVFSYVKSKYILICSGILFICLIADELKSKTFANSFKSKKNMPIFMGICLIVFANIAAYIFSDYKDVVLKGAASRYEGIFIIFSYIVIMLSVKKVASNENRIELILWFLLFSSLFVGLIGTIQYFTTTEDYNIYNSPLMSRLLLGREYSQGMTIRGNFQSVFSTLFNPNYVGSFVALVVPLYICIILFTDFRKITKIFCFIDTVLLLISLAGSKSEAGVLGLVVAVCMTLMFFVIMNLKTVEDKKKAKVIIAGILIITFTPLLLYFVIKPFREKVNILIDKSINTELYYKDISSNNNVCIITNTMGDIKLEYIADSEVINVYENNHILDSIPYNSELENYSNNINTASMGDISIGIKNGNINMTNNNVKFLFNVYYNKLVPLDAYGRKVDLNTPVPSIGFNGMESFASGRGFIWSRSLPIALEHVIIGTGADTFYLYFPQGDIKGKIKGLGNPMVLVDKPHNQYLLMLINGGIFYLVGYLILAIYCLKENFKQFSNTDIRNRNIRGISLGIMAAIVGYLVTGVANDSVVHVAPLYWTILGLGYAVMHIKSEGIGM